MQIIDRTIDGYALRSRLRHSFFFRSGGEPLPIADAAVRFSVTDLQGRVQFCVVSSSPPSEWGAITLDAERIGECVVEIDRLHIVRLSVGSYRYELIVCVAGHALRVKGAFEYQGDIESV